MTLGNASDVHMFMEVLFSSKRDFKTVVFNRYIGGKWHLPSRYADRQSFPFEKTKPFILQLIVEKTVFKASGSISFSDWKKGNVLFNDALNTCYLRLYGVRHMVKDHSASEKGNPLPPHRLLFTINSKGSFICTIPQTG